MRQIKRIALSQAEVRFIRERLELNQPDFATLFGIPLRSLRDWEYRDGISGAPAVLLLAIFHNPEGIVRAISEGLPQPLPEMFYRPYGKEPRPVPREKSRRHHTTRKPSLQR